MALEVALNIVAQIVFFVLVIWIIPWVGNLIVNKHSDLELLIQRYEDCENEKKKARLERAIDIYQWLIDIVMTIESWTHALIRTLLQFVVLVVTFNRPELTVKIGRGEEEEELDDLYIAKGQLYCEYVYDKASLNWYNPIKMVGHYISHVIHVLFSPAVGVALFALMLPSTFASMVSGFSGWAILQGNATGLDFFTCLYHGFVDVAWNRFVLEGFAENPILLILFLLIFSVFLSDAYIIVANDGKLSGGSLLCLPVTVAIMIALNAIFAAVSPAAYVSLGRTINVIGLAVFYVIMIKEIASTAIMCIRSALKIVLDKILPF